MSENIAEDILACLQAIEEALTSDTYEYSDPYTIGGGVGTYAIASPWNTECEWSLQGVTGNTSAVASFVLSPKNPGVKALGFSGAESFGNITGGKDSNPLVGFTGQLNTNQPFINFDSPWMPLAMPANLTMAVGSGGAGECLATICFRRKLLRYIPDKPRQQPHTHTHPAPRTHARKLAAQSTLVAGFEEQYPDLGTHNPFTHQDSRTVLTEGANQQQLAPGQDGSNLRRGVFPLGEYSNAKRRRNS